MVIFLNRDKYSGWDVEVKSSSSVIKWLEIVSVIHVYTKSNFVVVI